MTPKRNLKMMIFQSTLSMRRAKMGHSRPAYRSRFQSTLSMRRATAETSQ